MSEVKQFLPDIIDVNKPGIRFEITNFDLIKSSLADLLAQYANFELTDNISEAKDLRARLNKVSDALNTKKISVKKAYLEPYEYGEGQIKELISMIGNVSTNIDIQIKKFEENAKNKKREDITNLFNTFENPRKVPLAKIFNEKWLNATVTLKNVEKDIITFFEKLESDIVTIESLVVDEFRRADTIALYVDYLDMGRAIQEEKRIYDFNHRPAPTPIVQAPKVVVEPKVEATVEVDEAEPTEEFVLAISGTKSQLLEVRDFLKSKGIAYKFERR